MEDYKSKLREFRNQIDCIDENIVSLLDARAKVVKQVGNIKKKIGSKFYVPHREEEIVARLSKKSKGIFPKTAIRPVFREIISACLFLEETIKVAFLGPNATYTHEAAVKYFGQTANYVPIKTIPEIFEEVYKGRADLGVVPVENSSEGFVSYTLDTFLDYDLKISGEIILPISHCLVSINDKKDKIKKIYSHPQAFGQCRKWIERNMANCALIEVSSTAEAADMAKKDDSSAAIAGETSAKLYDLHLLEKNIQDENDNSTRFLIIGKFTQKITGNDRTSLIFSVKDEPGALYKMLLPFAENNINLTKIESRPIKTKAWEYVFFVDIEGHCEEKNVKKSIESLKKNCNFFKILGSYPIPQS